MRKKGQSRDEIMPLRAHRHTHHSCLYIKHKISLILPMPLRIKSVQMPLTDPHLWKHNSSSILRMPQRDKMQQSILFALSVLSNTICLYGLWHGHLVLDVCLSWIFEHSQLNGCQIKKIVILALSVLSNTTCLYGLWHCPLVLDVCLSWIFGHSQLNGCQIKSSF